MTDHPSNPPSQGPGCPMCHGSRTRQTLSLGIGDVSRTVECEVCIYADSALAAQEAQHKAEMEKAKGTSCKCESWIETCRQAEDRAEEAESKLRQAREALEGLMSWYGTIQETMPDALYAALAALRSGPAQQATVASEKCWTCGGYSNGNPKDCICGGTFSHVTEVQNMREEIFRLRGELPPKGKCEKCGYSFVCACADPPEQETPKPITSLLHDPPPCWCGRHRDSLSHSLGNFGGALFLHEYKPASAPPAHGGGD